MQQPRLCLEDLKRWRILFPVRLRTGSFYRPNRPVKADGLAGRSYLHLMDKWWATLCSSSGTGKSEWWPLHYLQCTYYRSARTIIDVHVISVALPRNASIYFVAIIVVSSCMCTLLPRLLLMPALQRAVFSILSTHHFYPYPHASYAVSNVLLVWLSWSYSYICMRAA